MFLLRVHIPFSATDHVLEYDLKKMPEMLAYYADKGCEVKSLAIYTGE